MKQYYSNIMHAIFPDHQQNSPSFLLTFHVTGNRDDLELLISALLLVFFSYACHQPKLADDTHTMEKHPLHQFHNSL